MLERGEQVSPRNPPGRPEPARAGPRRPVRRFNFISAVERRGPCRRAGRPPCLLLGRML